MVAGPDQSDLDSPERDQLRRLGRKVRRRLAANNAVHRIEADKAELWAVGQFLDELECGRLMSIIDVIARPSDAYGVNASSHRTSYTGDLHPDDPFIQNLEQRIDGLLGFDPANGETIQGQRYTVGQEFKPHVDWFPPSWPIWKREQDHGGQRAFTAMAYLNAVEEGGETDFPELDIAVKPRPGTLLIWNNADKNGVPNPSTLHAGHPVIRGVKYIITKWYRCGL
jgi:prolyl 4-hydroxylase